jgi:hypothetical protein
MAVSEIMEAAIVECQRVGVKPPPMFFQLKRKIERDEISTCFPEKTKADIRSERTALAMSRVFGSSKKMAGDGRPAIDIKQAAGPLS